MTAAYDWFQPGKINSAESGCALAVRSVFGTLDKTERIVGSDQTREGGGIRERSILRGRVKSRLTDIQFRAAAGHAPPSRAEKTRAAYLRTFKGVRAKFKGGDLNIVKRIAARLFGNKRVIGGGVLWLTVPRRGWHIKDWRMMNVNGDHKAVMADVVNNKTGQTVRFLVINCMSVSTGPKHAANIMAHGLRLHADVIMASECSDFRAVQVDIAVHSNEK